MNQALYAHMNNKRKRKKKIHYIMAFILELTLFGGRYWGFELRVLCLLNKQYAT
jgi:hypothetical protein